MFNSLSWIISITPSRGSTKICDHDRVGACDATAHRRERPDDDSRPPLEPEPHERSSSNAGAAEITAVNARCQMELDVIGADEPAFSQGALPTSCQRLIRNDLERRLLERPVKLAKQTSIFDRKKLPKTLRIAVDSRPLEGAG